MKTVPVLPVSPSPSSSLPVSPRPRDPATDRATRWAFTFYLSMVVVSVFYFLLLLLVI